MTSDKILGSSNKLFWLASYPKSGNTWFRIFLSNLVNSSDAVDINNLSFGQYPVLRSMFDELNGFCSTDLSVGEIERIRPTGLSWLNLNSDSEQYFKTHAAFSYNDRDMPVLGSNASGIAGALYFVRNPLDVCISYAHHGGVSIDTSIEILANPDLKSHSLNSVHFLPEFVGSWSQHVESWVNADDLNVHVIRYEDMLNASIQTFTGACEFLRVTTDSHLIQESLGRCNFNSLQKIEEEIDFVEKPISAERFFRKGIAGDWQNTLSDKQVEKIVQLHAETMRKFGYLDERNNPKVY